MIRAQSELRKLQGVLRICDFGENLVPYGVALKYQGLLARACKDGSAPDTLLQLQHPAVYTIGKRGKTQDFLKSHEELRQLGAEIYTAPRGGETTFHGPGQLIMYPIVNLRRLGVGARKYVEGLEDSIISALDQLGVKAQGRQPNRTGVWVGDEKIAAIGVQISGGLTQHGLALNVNSDLRYFKHIVPCGLPDFNVTSLQSLVGVTDIQLCSQLLRQSFVRQFGYTSLHSMSENNLLASATP